MKRRIVEGWQDVKVFLTITWNVLSCTEYTLASGYAPAFVDEDGHTSTAATSTTNYTVCMSNITGSVPADICGWS